MSDCRKIFLDNLFYLMGQRKWTMARLSVEGDISFSTIRTFLYNSENMPKVETIEKIATAFGLTVSDMLAPDLTEYLKIKENLKTAYSEAEKDLKRIELSLFQMKAAVQKMQAL